ncbi:Cys/Met metabolism PLP-dependent enzyme-domain-containing protein [Annulohypoxylon moriforme]|nr:Cys/Met metabolism PLP-dependent enzyme-domain-containing protein [Annulohypoxylon moriforme]
MASSTQKQADARFATLAVHAGLPHDPATGALSEPISLATTFAQSDIAKPIGRYVYSRSNNPNRESLELAIAKLEYAKYAIAFSSGLAATTAVFQGLASGGHIICNADLYGGTYRLLKEVANTHGITVTFISDFEQNIKGAIQDNTKLIWIESPSNPTLSLIDIRVVADIAHEKQLFLVVDNTMLSPYIQNPLLHGADIVLHSVTKYINGHSDVLMGAVALNSEALHQRLRFLQNSMGIVPSPFDCWLAHRGLKTLHLRAQTASTNAATLADLLATSSHVIHTNYPGLETHPQRNVARKQHREGMGGAMISFRIRGGGDAAARFCRRTKYFTLAESLGGVESLCEVPARMTHAAIPREAREQVGVFDDLIRLSIGIEDVEDLKEDLINALAAATSENE